MTDDRDTTELALAVMTKSFCEWCEWAAKVAGFETDDTAELREGVEEKIRTAEREGYMMALERVRAKATAWASAGAIRTVAAEVELEAPGEPTPS